MNLVIDANILFAAVIKQNITSELMFNEKISLFAPFFILEELEKYREIIKKKTGKTDSDFNCLLEIFKRQIQIIPVEEIIFFLDPAKTISPDEKDITYIALAIKLDCAIWSNDKALKDKQKVVPVYSTEDLLHLLFN